MMEIRNIHESLVGKPKGNIPLGRFRSRYEDNIKTGLKDAGCGLDS
jgi:hypothetical protein